MNEEVDNTQERPVVNATRRGRTAVRAEQSASRGRNSNSRRSSGAAHSATRDRRQGARHASQASASRRGSTSPRNPKRRGGVPVIVVILLLVVAVAASVYITRAVLTPQIEEAHKEAAVAKSQVSTLTQQLSSATAGQSSSSTNSSSNFSSSKEGDSSKNESAKGEGVDSPWTKSGKFTSGDAVLDSEVKAFCDSIANSSMDRDTAVLEVYKGVAWSEYVERDAAQHPSGKNWRTEFARMYYENGSSGNCYEFAAFLSYCMQYMGFDDAKAEGVLIQLQGGGWGDHGIVYVTSSDGTKCVCDTARGTDGWMLPESTYNVQMQDFENA